MAPSSGRTSLIPGRVKACNACRQHKLRCDAHEDNYGSCSRCRRMHRDCVITPTLQRRNRQTKAELEREIGRLRAQCESLPFAGATDVVQSMDRDVGDGDTQRRGWERTLGEDLTSEGAEPMSITVAASDGFLPGVARDSYTQSHDAESLSQTSPSQATQRSSYYVSNTNGSEYQAADASPGITDTIPRTIAEKEFDARRIDGCVSSFFQHYAQTVPGLIDDLDRANELFDYSEFLFWTVVYIGSRKFTKDPTMVEFLTKPLGVLAQQYLFEPEQAISSIKAAILICLWPLPVDTNFIIRTHAMAGAAMQLAMQKGLPFATRKQDFFRIPLRQSKKDETDRARLWAYCLMVFQSNNLYDGLPCTMAIDATKVDWDVGIFSGLPPIVAYQYRLHRIQIDATAAMLSCTYSTDNGNSDLINSLVKHFDTEAQRVPNEVQDDLSHYTLVCARMLIRAFHFFASPTTQRDSEMLHSYSIACDLIETASRLDSKIDFGQYCTNMQARAASCAATFILRVLRSHLTPHVNAEMGESMIFEAIRLSKRHSIRIDDLDARNAIILTQLWSSSRLFRYKDGTVDGLRLLLRARLSMSPFLDSHWWWRAEFGGKSNPYLEADTAQTADSSKEGIRPETVMPQADNQPGINTIDPEMMPNLSFYADLPDWNWDELGDFGID